MEKTNIGKITPGGNPGELDNPLAPLILGGGGQLLLEDNPFRKSSRISRSPPNLGETAKMEMDEEEDKIFKRILTHTIVYHPANSHILLPR